MKTFFKIGIIVGLTSLLSSCLFKEPAFTENFAKTGDTLTGVWITEENGDPRKSQYAVCVPIDESRYLLHHPARSEDSFYYEARPVKRRDRTLLQLRVLSTFKDGVPKPGSEIFTLLWIQTQEDGRLSVRAAGGDGGLSGLPPGEARKALEDPSSDWDKLFDEAREYRRLENRD